MCEMQKVLGLWLSVLFVSASLSMCVCVCVCVCVCMCVLCVCVYVPRCIHLLGESHGAEGVCGWVWGVVWGCVWGVWCVLGTIDCGMSDTGDFPVSAAAREG